MSTFKKTKIIDPATGSPVIVEVGADAKNIDFSDGSNLQDSFVPFTGAEAAKAGAKGLVPAPAAGDQDKYLKADGTWGTPSGGGGTAGVSSLNGSAGDLSLETSSIDAPSAWNAGAVTAFTVKGSTLEITKGTLPSLTTTATTVATGRVTS